MVCELCKCHVIECDAAEVEETFGEDYSKKCLDCASDEWHDANTAPGDDEE